MRYDSLFSERIKLRPPTARGHAARTGCGLTSLLNRTQDVVSMWCLDYARRGTLSRFSPKFIRGLFNFKNNKL
jgi:hypothetical protein